MHMKMNVEADEERQAGKRHDAIGQQFLRSEPSTHRPPTSWQESRTYPIPGQGPERTVHNALYGTDAKTPAAYIPPGNQRQVLEGESMV